MFGLDLLQTLFAACAFLFQIILIIHFALRKWRFAFAIQHGWIVYALSIPAAAVSAILLHGGMVWSLWLAGFLYLLWAGYGFTVEYARKIEWRSPIRWRVLARMYSCTWPRACSTGSRLPWSANHSGTYTQSCSFSAQY